MWIWSWKCINYSILMNHALKIGSHFLYDYSWLAYVKRKIMVVLVIKPIHIWSTSNVLSYEYSKNFDSWKSFEVKIAYVEFFFNFCYHKIVFGNLIHKNIFYAFTYAPPFSSLLVEFRYDEGEFKNTYLRKTLLMFQSSRHY